MRGPPGRGRGLLTRPSFNHAGMNANMSPGPRGMGMHPRFGPRHDFVPGPPGPMGAGPGGPTVIMAYGFDPDLLSCEGIFNLLCPFGNVMKVGNTYILQCGACCVACLLRWSNYVNLE